MFPPFSCGSADPNNDKSKAVIELVMAEIKLRQDVTPLNKANELSGFRSRFTKIIFKLIPEKLIEGRNGQGNLDYAIECHSTGRILGIIEVKKLRRKIL
ncbi:hypothetical protein RirG_035470 [Rhizophagus irregularis DAOM 197198w]|uniref:Uncharacterized protein n=1 Tax=Rhizophagus irregularis (strain DAOM 197198w) TaxID=1432141 RepID=A0A015LU29_RHIIW|nr:hypothetical protein RirG_035470 [Rhizophagus irregularis DAOM 197198w]